MTIFLNIRMYYIGITLIVIGFFFEKKLMHCYKMFMLNWKKKLKRENNNVSRESIDILDTIASEQSKT